MTLTDLNVAIDEADLLLFHKIYCDNSISLNLKMSSYLRNVGFRKHYILKMVREKLLESACEAGKARSYEDVFDKAGRLQSLFVEEFGSGNVNAYPEVATDHETIQLHNRSLNEWFSDAFPDTLKFATRNRDRVEIRAYSSPDTAVWANGCGHQVYTSDLAKFYPSASPYCFSNAAIDCPQTKIEGNLVLICDIFSGSNFAHFMFDWLPRLNLACEIPGLDVKNTYFLAGGHPTRLHYMALESACGVLGLKSEQILFPSSSTLLKPTSSTYWFSDSYEDNMHPANHMHPVTVDFLKKMGRSVHSKIGEADENRIKTKIYISRSDANNRRVSNESEIREYLSDQDFQIVELSRHDVDQQVRIVSSANTIVAPHGMGLAHLVFSQNAPKVIELFHPNIGTDAYCVLSRALGFDYRAIFGSPAGHMDFTVSIEDLRHQLL